MKTFTGLNKETPCACGCGQRMPANPTIQVVVDMDSRPWKRYIPGHEPMPSRSYRGKAEQKPVSAPAPTPPAPAGPAPTPPQPQVEPTPVPVPKVTTGVAPTLADNRPWKILTVTISVGDYTSIKAGVADFGRENESMTELGSRLVAELTNDVKTELDVVHQVQAGKPLSVTTKGAVIAPQTLSPAATAGAPAPKGVVGPEMMETRRLVSMELDDVSAVRSVKKRKIGNQWLKAHGYESFDQVLPTDLAALQQLLAQFESINLAVDAPQHPLSEPVFQAASSEAGASR
jgi:hypothetical protein